MKRTKIVCTIGPACNSVLKLTKLALAGMNVARINLSHGNEQSHKEIIDNIKTVRKNLNIPIAIMADTKGPEIRIKNFADGQITLKKNRLFTLTTDEVIGTESKVSLAYKNLINQIKLNDKIFANNGMVVLKVRQITSTDIVCKVVFGGKLTNGKGLNIPGIVPQGEYLSQKDKQDLQFAVQNDVDIIAASFVSNSSNIKKLREYLNSLNANKISIVAKIENHEGVKNLKSIIQESDGLMVARGDLGVEIALEKLPAVQKRAIKLCNTYGKTVIIATEMLESMTASIRPTRAEVSDVAYAIYDKASATMLSGETAVGKYPENTVKTMDKIIKETEKNIKYNKDFTLTKKHINSVVDSIGHTTVSNAVNLNAKLIVTFTTDSKQVNVFTKYRVKPLVLAITNCLKTYNTLSLTWGAVPHFCNQKLSQEDFCEYAKKIALEKGLAFHGDLIVVELGNFDKSNKSNMTKIITC